MTFRLLAIAIFLLALGLPLHAQSNVTNGSYNFKERFGVYHVPQVICFTDTAAKQNPNTSRMLAPNGVDVVPFQQVSDGTICVQSAIPQSTVPAVYTDNSNGTVDMPTNSIYMPITAITTLKVGDLIYYESGGGTDDCGVFNANNYYIAGNPSYARFTFSATNGGSVIPLTTTSCGNSIKWTRTGFTAVSSTNTFTSPAHHYSLRDPIQFEGTGSAIPSNVVADHVYYVAGTVTTNTFQISATVGGSVFSIGSDVTVGLNRIVTDWTWTLQNGTTPGGSITNQLSIDFSSSSEYAVSNGLMKAWIGRFTNPVKTWSVANGKMTSVTVTNGPFDEYVTLTDTTGLAVNDHVTVSGATQSFLNFEATVTAISGSKVTLSGASGFAGTSSNANLTMINAWFSKNPLTGFQLNTSERVASNGLLYVAGTDSAVQKANGTFLDGGLYTDKPTPFNLSYSTSFDDAGPLKTVLRACYVTNRPVYVDSNDVVIGGGHNTAGTGQFCSVFTFYAGRPSFLVEEITDMNYGWYGDTYTNAPTKPDRRQLRGTGNGTWPAGCGYVYPSDTTSPHDSPDYVATENLTYARNVIPSTECNTGTRNWMGVWYGYAFDRGHSNWLFKASDGSTGNVVGIYAGRASLATIGALPAPYGYPFYVGIYTSNNWFVNSAIGAGISMVSEPPLSVGGLNSREIGIFTGTKADINADADIYGYSNLNHEQNIMAGVSANKLAKMDFAFANPAGGWKHAFMDDAAVATVCSNYQNNTPTSPVVSNWTTLVNTSTSTTTADILTICAGGNTAAVETALSTYYLSMLNYMDSLINGDGIFQPPFAGTGFQTTRALSVLQFTLAYSATSADQALRAKAYASLIGGLAVDQDVYPLLAACADSCGNANQAQQLTSSFNFAGTIFATQPQIAPYVPIVAANTTGQINTNFNAYGACFSSTAYCGTLNPVFAVALSQKKLNNISPIRYPKLQKFCEFYGNMLTPPEPRFGGNSSNGMARKFNSWGTSWLGDSNFLGLCATLWDGVDTTLSQNSIAGWFSVRSTGYGYLGFGDFFLPDPVAINTTITQATRTLTTKNWPGYFIALRHNFGTANESAVFLGTPSFLTDHWHWHDYGQIDAYLLGVPFIVDPAADEYFPDSNGCRWGSVVCLDSRNTSGSGAYNEDLTSITDSPQYYGSITQCDVLNFTKVALGCAQQVGTDTWTRNAILTNGNAALPILAVLDKFTVNGTATPSLIARTGSFLPLGTTVSTPFGSITPTARTVECAQSPSTFPSGGTSNALGSGLQSFSMVGPTWTSLGAGGNGIDTDFYMLRGTSGAHVALGAFTLSCTTTREMNEFSNANSGAGYSETHVRLMTNDTGDMTTFFAPHFKNVTPARTVTAITGGIQVVTTSPVSTTETLTSTQYTFTDGTAKALASFDTASHTAFSLTLTGNPSEIACSTSTACVWTVSSMTAGTACVDLSAFGGTWYASAAVTNPSTNKVCRYHPGSDPVTGQPAVYTVNLSTTPNSAVPALVSFGKPSGATTIRVQINGQYVSSASCGSTACETTVLAAPGFTEAHDYQ